MIRSVLLLLALTLPAQATEDQWPALFDVSGVAADDRLNIRAEPSTEARIIGALDHDATDVEVIEPSERHDWGLVNVGEQRGWVSLRFLSRQPGQWFGAGIRPASCFGTEPFWGFDVEGNQVTWRSQDSGESRNGTLGDYIPGSNAWDREAVTLRLADGRDGVAIFRLDSCSDYMSDRAYGIAIDLVIGDPSGTSFYSGCCSLLH